MEHQVTDHDIGAAFERPAEKYPRVFGNDFFRKYPYVLPGLVVSALTLTSAFTTLLFVKEVRLQSTCPDCN